MKTIVIIGGSSGIGLALVQRSLGENVINISRSPCPVSGVTDLRADAADPKQLAAAFSEIDKIDALVYCAGVSMAAPVECVEAKDYRRLFDVNLFGAIEAIKLALPLLRKSDDGRIVLLSSAGAVAPIAYDGSYSASKAGLLALATAMRLEAPDILTTAVVVPATMTQFSFKRKVYTDCGDYGRELKSASDSLIKMEQTGYSADYVARKIQKLLSRPAPPQKVTIGTKNKLSLFFYRLLPQSLKLWALRRTYGL